MSDAAGLADRVREVCGRVFEGVCEMRPAGAPTAAPAGASTVAPTGASTVAAGSPR